MIINYAITLCTEFEEIQRLVSFILKHKRNQDKIIILLDTPKSSSQLRSLLEKWDGERLITLIKGEFYDDFSMWKNELNYFCEGDWIFNIDADEIPNMFLIKNLPLLIEANPEIELFGVPRINTLDGDKEEIAKYAYTQKWKINPQGWINFPDYQGRIFKNNRKIKWLGKVHETLIGYNRYNNLPAREEYCLYHPKTLKKQIFQNQLYDKL